MSKDLVNGGDVRKEKFDDGEEGLEVLPDYEDLGGEDEQTEHGKKGLAVRSSGFKEFMLNKEVYRAVVENGFEHPSEGPLSTKPHSDEGVWFQCNTSASLRLCWDGTWSVKPRVGWARRQSL